MINIDTRWKTIWAVGLILILISGFNLYQTITLQRSHLAEIIRLEEKAQNLLAQNIEQRTLEYYDNKINELTNVRKDIMQSFAQRDRKKLLALCQPIYESLKKENSSFFIFHFFLPDTTTFLRVHTPDFYGDDLTEIRPIIKEVNRTHMPAAGYEIGRMGIFYRIAQPVFIDEQYVGAFEFGINIDKVLTTIRENFSSDIALLIDKKQYSKATLIKAEVTVSCSSHVLLTQGNTFFEHIASHGFDFDCDADSSRVEMDDHTYHMSNAITIDNYQSTPIGKIIIAMDISDHIAKLRHLIQLSIITTTVLLLVALLFLHISIGSLLNKIFSLNSKLTEINENLESTVNQRTTELEGEIHERKQAFKTLEQEILQRHEIELKLEKEAIKAVKLESVGVLSGGIAHDFNNILSAILGNINLAAMVTGPDHEIHEMLKTAEKATIRARDLTSQLLSFSQANSPVKRTSSIKDVIEDAALLAPSGYEVKCTYKNTEMWPAKIDQEQISQVFQKIISNSCRAMPDGGNITVTCANIDRQKSKSLSLPEENYVLISISDTGCGIEEKHLSKIFDPYFSTQERDSHKGSGLGLAITHSIIIQHDGFIRVKSSQAKGTTFTIFLPARPDLTEMQNKPDTEHQDIQGKGKILVMDDEQIVLDIAKMMLTHMGYNVTLTRDGEEMLTQYQQAQKDGQGFSLVIMDLNIPGGMGGQEAITKLLKIDPQAISIVSSGYANDPIMAQYQDYGFAGILKKPFQVEELWRALRNVTFETKITSSQFKI